MKEWMKVIHLKGIYYIKYFCLFYFKIVHTETKPKFLQVTKCSHFYFDRKQIKQLFFFE